MGIATLNKTKAIVLAEAVLFFFFTAFGISGSSISANRSVVTSSLSMDEKLLIGYPQRERFDEWAVNSLLAIGQYQNKENKNPRINSNLGPTPRDMSIIHDTGVPTRELSTISKVNLWGFFLFDLRRALAWHWWIPIFVGLNGIWLLLNLLCPGQSLFNFSLALLFTLAPESVLWSNWPLMHVGTVSLGVSLAILALKNTNILVSLALACAMGILTSWFILQLYLPRLIPIALISMATYAGYCITNRVRFFTKSNCIFIVYAAMIASCFLFDWYSHNYDAISRMLNSSYPGQRRIYGGIPLSSWDFNYIRGWLFPITAYRELFRNVCEQQSYIGLFIPVGILILYYVFHHHSKLNYVVLFNFGLLLLFVAYEYTSIPKVIGKLTLLDRTTQPREIIGTGFTTLILLAFLYKYKDIIIVRQKMMLLPIFLLPFVIFFCRNQEFIQRLNDTEGNLFKIIYIVCFIVAINVLLLYRIKYVTLALLLYVTPVTLFWNPIIIAPSHVSVSLPKMLSENPGNLKYDGRMLVIGDAMQTNLFFAAGNKLMNATSHYVDPYMFDTFYSKLDDPKKYNKFNHLVVGLDNSKPNIGIEGIGDRINIRLNARNFDFSSFPIDYVAVYKYWWNQELNLNSKLKFMEVVGDFYFYRVIY